MLAATATDATPQRRPVPAVCAVSMATGVLLLWQFAAGLGYVSVVAVAVAAATTPVAAVWWVRGAPGVGLSASWSGPSCRWHRCTSSAQRSGWRYRAHARPSGKVVRRWRSEGDSDGPIEASNARRAGSYAGRVGEDGATPTAAQRLRVAGHPAILLGLDQLAVDAEESFRREVAMKRNTPPDAGSARQRSPSHPTPTGSRRRHAPSSQRHRVRSGPQQRRHSDAARRGMPPVSAPGRGQYHQARPALCARPRPASPRTAARAATSPCPEEARRATAAACELLWSAWGPPGATAPAPGGGTPSRCATPNECWDYSRPGIRRARGCATGQRLDEPAASTTPLRVQASSPTER